MYLLNQKLVMSALSGYSQQNQDFGTERGEGEAFCSIQLALDLPELRGGRPMTFEFITAFFFSSSNSGNDSCCPCEINNALCAPKPLGKMLYMTAQAGT